MSKAKGKAKRTSKEEEKRTIEYYFDEFASFSRHSGNKALQIMFLPLFFFGVLGVVWMIPFPEFAFLKERGWDIFLNWASIYIAIVVYYFLRLAPMLSYAVLLSIGVMSYFVVQLEYWDAAGGLPAWMVFGMFAVLSFILLWLGSRVEEKRPSFKQFLKLLVHGLPWLWHFVFRRLKITY